MPDDSFIIKAWDEQINVFSKNLHLIKEGAARKPVHDIRVAVKKIRSYLRLRQAMTAETWKEPFLPASFIFKALGKQRDFEITLSLLSNYHRREKIVLNHFRKFLQTNGRLARRWSKQAAQHFNEETLKTLSDSFHVSLADPSNEEVTQKIRDIVISSLKKVRKLSFNFKKNIHEVRKLLKDLFYWLKACPENPVNDLIKLKLLDKTLNDLGRWQDYFIFLNKLKEFKNEFSVKGSDEFNSIKVCEEKIKTIQNELLRKIKIKGAEIFLK